MRKIHIDFQVYDSNDPKQIIILDTSIWAHIEDKISVIEVIVPGSKKSIGHIYTKKGITILNSINLGLNCADCGEEFIDLPDGVYEITVKGSPDKFNKKRYYLRTTLTQKKLDDILINSYSECKNCLENNEDIEKILRYNNLLKVAESLVRRGYKSDAQDIIFKIQDFLKKFKNCKKCPHKV